ncbi:hypothetical protein C8R43DRAFT_471745 [Mycena crocata]|nr:hypothetical protein C8R43DRAFT_471745 [Mycena crocata]
MSGLRFAFLLSSLVHWRCCFSRQRRPKDPAVGYHANNYEHLYRKLRSFSPQAKFVVVGCAQYPEYRNRNTAATHHFSSVSTLSQVGFVLLVSTSWERPTPVFCAPWRPTRQRHDFPRPSVHSSSILTSSRLASVPQKVEAREPLPMPPSISVNGESIGGLDDDLLSFSISMGFYICGYYVLYMSLTSPGVCTEHLCQSHGVFHQVQATPSL